MATVKTLIGNVKGPAGPTGPSGTDGKNGADGFSPTVQISKVGTVTTITITDKNGSHTATINDGEDGKDGATGSAGQDGSNGSDGADGFSPTVSISKSGKVTTITITDKDGVHTATINDGADGQDGANGKDGSDATVTSTNIKNALGYTPANEETVSELSEEIANHEDDTTVHITSAERTKWNNKSEFSGKYDDLTGKPTIPSIDGLASESYVNGKVNNLSLGVGEDGRIYLLNGGIAQGNGVDIPSGASGDVVGNVGENNIIILSGNLEDGTYTFKYEMDNGSVVNIGNATLDSNVYYSITNNLTSCTNGNSATKVIENNSYEATISVNSGYKLSSITVTMGGTNVTSSVVSGNKITISKVTGNIVITATAIEDVPTYTNLANPSSSDWWADSRIGSDGTVRTGSDCVGFDVSNFIGPLNVGDTVYVEGLDLSGTASTYRSAPYKSDKTVHGSYGIALLTALDGICLSDVVVTSTGGHFTNTKSDVKYWKIAGKRIGTAEDVIITINEPID